MKISRHYVYFIAFICLISCNKGGGDGQDRPNAPLDTFDLSTISIPASQTPLYANIDEYNLVATNPQTRSLSEISVSLESLLARREAQHYPFENQIFLEIPFSHNKNDYLGGISDEMGGKVESLTPVKKFYMEMRKNGTVIRYVVTMIPESQYYKFHPDFDYLHKPNFTGVAITSSLEGDIIDVKYYSGGRILDAELLTKEQINNDDYEKYCYVMLYTKSPKTRSTDDDETDDGPIEKDGGSLNASVCVATRKTNNEDENSNHHNEDTPERDSIDPNEGGGGGNGNGSSSDGEDANDKERDKHEPKYRINLSSNKPDKYTVYGSGSYTEGTKINICCAFTHCASGDSQTEVPFRRWIGDLKDQKAPSFVYIVEKDIISTAVFEDNGPCFDNDRGLTNPTKQMSVAATSSGSFYGGTFGMTRDEGTTRHTGIDIAAQPGTELYAMYSGTVHKIVSSFEDKHVKNSYGNEFVLKCSVNGQYYYIMYSHLQAGTPIAINPRTNKPFKEGDEVFEGDLIAYSGKTGNAFNDVSVPNKHVHLGIGTDWQTDHRKTNWIDPLPFLNGTIDVDPENKKSSEEFYNIKCD